MLRALAMCLLLSGHAAAQKQPPTPPPPPLSFDATVIGADGRPVTGLTAKDFELTHRGETREIESVTWIAQPASVIVVVDDLGLAPERVAALQGALRVFVAQLKPQDRAAMARVSSGVGSEQLLTTDRAPFVEQIERLQPIARGINDVVASRAIWQGIRWAIDGLPSDSSRKAIVLVAEPAHVAALGQNDSVITPAHYKTAVFYVVDLNPTPPPINFAKQTGGASVPDLGAVLRELEGYYKISFLPVREGMYFNPPALRLRDVAGTVRWRSGYPSEATPLLDKPAPLAGGDLRVDVAALYTGFDRGAASHIDVMVHVDGRDISTVRDLKGVRHGSLDIEVIPFAAGGRAPGSLARTVEMDLDEEKYQQLLKMGIQISTRITVPVSGAHQIRAVVTDARSGRIGSAMEFLDIPPASSNVFALSGLLLRDADKPPEVQATATFRVGASMEVMYGLFSATLGPNQESRVSVHTRLFAGSRLVYDGSPTELSLAPTGVPQVRTKINLDSHLSPGTYAIEVECTDLLSKDAAPRIARQSRVFQIAE